MKTNKQVPEQSKTLAKPSLPIVPLTDKDMSYISGGGGLLLARHFN